MGTWRYVLTDVRSGEIRADTLPLFNVSFSTTFLGTDQLTAEVTPTALSSSQLAALQIRRNLLWVLYNEYPVWCGVVWDWDTPSAYSGKLSLTANTFDTLLLRRTYDLSTRFKSRDPLYIVRALIAYTKAKTYGALPALTVSAANLGTSITVQYTGSEHTPIMELIASLAEAESFEWRFQPRWNGDDLELLLDLGATVGTTKDPLLYCPGNVKDYAFSAKGSDCLNHITAVSEAGPTGAQWASGASHGYAANDLVGGGSPLLEGVVSCSGTGITSQARIDAWADRAVRTYASAALQPTILCPLGKGTTLSPSILSVGDTVELSLTSPVHPSQAAGTPGLTATCRVVGVGVVVGNGGTTDSMTVTCGGINA